LIPHGVQAYIKQKEEIMSADTLSAKDLRKLTRKIIASGEVEVVASGTAITIPTNTNAVWVLVINNSPNLVVCGVDNSNVVGNVDPVKGFPLNQYESHAIPVTADASEVYIDADTSNTKVSYQIYGA
jgi:hypothetical protein